MNSQILKGGEFLIKDTDYLLNFTPEDLSDDQQMIRQSVRDFVEHEIWPKGNILSEQVGLLMQAAELGLLGAHIPEIYGGAP